MYLIMLIYKVLADKVLGYYGALAVDVCIFIGGYGSLLSYILIIGIYSIYFIVVPYENQYLIYLYNIYIYIYCNYLCMSRHFND